MYHKFVGLGVSLFLMLFCVSGILLNHKSGISNINVERSFLPSSYQYDHWNKGSLRGTVDISQPGDSAVLFYGNTGIWQFKWPQERFFDFNQGLPFGAEGHDIRAVVKLHDGQLFAINETHLYQQGLHSTWGEVALPGDEELSDLTKHRDTLIVVGRSHLFVAVAPYTHFETVTILQPEDYKPRVSLLQIVWELHSGSILGVAGRVVMDIIAIVLLFLLLSGWFQWLFPKYIHRIKGHGYRKHMAIMTMKQNRRLHEFVGRKTIWVTLFIAVTGWMLRPPMVIPLTILKFPAIPGFTHFDNAWHEKLRMIRYDRDQNDWILSTSDGFYALPTLDSTPVRIATIPSVCSMGTNVLCRDEYDNWLIGSYSGMYVWSRYEDIVLDYFTGNRIDLSASFNGSGQAVSGYISVPYSFSSVVEYETGTESVAQPEIINSSPVSLRFLASEIHTGRIYTLFSGASVFCVFLVGGLICWGIWSGWEVRHRRK
jgi:hypothetical protein